MTVRICFKGLTPGRPLVMFAWAAFANDPVVSANTTVHFGRELADVFQEHWTVVPEVGDCDVVVFPHGYEDGAETARVADAARTAGKPCVFFSHDERLPPSRLSYGTLYRGSIFTRLPHERAHPVFIHDIRLETDGAAGDPVPKSGKPVVGFCGFVGTPLSRALLRLVGAGQKVAGLSFRAKVLSALRRDARVDCRFVERSKYLGAAPLSAFRRDHPLADEREAFLSNLLACPYGLAMRGKGNHSVRFYEILSAGRIPLFVNTGCVLPLESEIDWKSHSVWVEDRDLPEIGERLVAFHSRITDTDFIELQRRIRRLWVDRLRPEPFFTHVFRRVASGAPAP